MALNIELKQGWDTLGEAIDYFLDLVLELHAYKKHLEVPENLFLSTTTGDKELDEKLLDTEFTITLESL